MIIVKTYSVLQLSHWNLYFVNKRDIITILTNIPTPYLDFYTTS